MLLFDYKGRLLTVMLAILMLAGYGLAQCRSCSRGGCSSGSCGGGEAVYLSSNYYQPSGNSCASGNCPGGNCSTQPVPMSSARFVNMLNTNLFDKPATDKVEWLDVPGAPTQKAKYVNGKHVGSWSSDGDFYRSLDNGKWGEPVYIPPSDLPDSLRKQYEANKVSKVEKDKLSVGDNAIPSWMKNGVDVLPSSNERNTYIINGKHYEEGSFTGPDTQGSCPNMSGKDYITIFVRDPARREQIKKEVEASPLSKSEKHWIQVLAPDSWQAKTHKLSESKNFANTGVCVFYQSAKNKDGFSQPLFSDNVYTTPEDIGRKIDEGFHMDDVPSSSSKTTSSALIPLAAIALIAFAVLTPKKEEEQE